MHVHREPVAVRVQVDDVRVGVIIWVTSSMVLF